MTPLACPTAVHESARMPFFIGVCSMGEKTVHGLPGQKFCPK